MLRDGAEMRARSLPGSRPVCARYLMA